ncbi:hypothetical protein [Burkholderia stagnalis]|uniref:hypothetical protein n=1 Tax=Burkholderia stagnalis TaxID=1503054 RepID=UPI0007C74161|nr:hypothetical protein [Burkholderia stagnalis]
MKPRPNWAYVWEYTCPHTGKRTLTWAPFTRRELADFLGPAEFDLSAPIPLTHTQVDRNVVPLDIGLKHVPRMPAFDAPTEAELREFWNAFQDPEARRIGRLLILEVVTLRRSLQKFQDWYRVTDQNVTDKGDFGGPMGPFIRFYHLLREELARATML